MHTRYWKEIQDIAAKYALDPLLVEAIVLTESAGNTDAFRFEPDFYNRYIKPKKMFPGMNPRRISSSYGLMQLMWPVAVERGFPAANSPELLFLPETGLEYGCKHLRFLTDWAAEFKTRPVDGSVTGATALVTDLERLEATIAGYNGGRGGNKPTESPKRNISYVRKVFANLSTLQKIGAAA